MAASSVVRRTDIAAASIDEAHRRHQQRAAFPADYLALDAFAVDLQASNLFPQGPHFPAGAFFDVVSCQFALHYAFATEERARQFVRNAAVRLRPGGIFLGTMPNANLLVYVSRFLSGTRTRLGTVAQLGSFAPPLPAPRSFVPRGLPRCLAPRRPPPLSKRRRLEGRREFGNSVYRVVFDAASESPARFGERYVFHLEDAIDDLPEYLADFSTLCL